MMQSNIKSTWLAAAVAIAAVSASPIDIASPVELAERAAASNYLFTLYVLSTNSSQSSIKQPQAGH
jgi:hypothetical protein